MNHLDNELQRRPLVGDVGDTAEDEAHDGDEKELQPQQETTFSIVWFDSLLVEQF